MTTVVEGPQSPPDAVAKKSPYKLGIKITENQVPKTKEWLAAKAKELMVSALIADSGRILIKGETKEICEKAALSIRTRVMLDDFHNALEIFNLIEQHPHHESFTVEKAQLVCLRNDPTAMDVIVNYEQLLKCVVKVDQSGHVSIFGEQQNCEELHRFFVELVENYGPKNEPKIHKGPVPSEISADDADKTLEENDIAEGIDAAINGDLSGGETTDNESVKTVVSPSPTLSNVNGASKPIISDKREQKPASSTKTFPQHQNGDNGQKPVFAARYAFKEKLVIDKSHAGRVIGKFGKNRIRVEQAYNCRLTIDNQESYGMTAVMIEGNNEEEVKAAKKDIWEMLKKPGPSQMWQAKFGQRSFNGSGGSSNPHPDAESGGHGGGGSSGSYAGSSTNDDKSMAV